MQEQYLRERLERCWIDLHKDGRGVFVWLISWVPDPENLAHPARKYSPFDSDLPDDYPGATEPDPLLSWGRARWGGA